MEKSATGNDDTGRPPIIAVRDAIAKSDATNALQSRRRFAKGCVGSYNSRLALGL